MIQWKSPERIKMENSFNRFVNVIVNNRISNGIKALWMTVFGSGSAEYLYEPSTGEYINLFTKERLDDGRTGVTVTVAVGIGGATDYTKLNWFQKRSLLKDVNRFFNGEKSFRWQRVIRIG